MRQLRSGENGRRREAIFLDRIAHLLMTKVEWISLYEIHQLQRLWEVRVQNTRRYILARMPRANLIRVSGSNLIPPQQAILPPGLESLIFTRRDPYEHLYWITLTYGPCTKEEEIFFEDILQSKGWKEVSRPPALQAQYFKISGEGGVTFFYTEPRSSYHSIMDGEAERQEELYDGGEDGEEVSAVVLRILQAGVERAAAADQATVEWTRRSGNKGKAHLR